MSESHVQELEDEAELDQLIEATLRGAGVKIADLRDQAHRGRFDSEKQRRAWFVIEGLGRG